MRTRILALCMMVVLLCASFVTGASAEDQVLQLWHIQTQETMQECIADSVARFEAANPGWKVEVNCFQNEDYKQKIVIALGSNTQPDIFVTWTGGGMVEYIEAGQIVPLTEYMNKDNWKDHYMDAAIAQATYNGEIWCSPTENCSIAAVFYNKAMFEKLGIAVPTTVTELEAACDTLVANGIVPFGLPNKSKYFGSMYYMYLVDRMAGPSLFESAANRTGATFQDEVFTWAGEKLQDWARKGYFGEGYTSMDGETGAHREMFYNEECAMLLDGSWCVSTYYADEAPILDDIGVFAFPAVEGGKGDPNNLVGTLGDTFYCVSSKCANPEMAFEMCKYLIDDVAVEKRIALGRIPPVKSAYVDNAINEALLGLLKAAPSIQLWYDQYLPSDLAEVHKNTLQSLLALEITVAEYDSTMENAILAK